MKRMILFCATVSIVVNMFIPEIKIGTDVNSSSREAEVIKIFGGAGCYATYVANCPNHGSTTCVGGGCNAIGYCNSPVATTYLSNQYLVGQGIIGAGKAAVSTMLDINGNPLRTHCWSDLTCGPSCVGTDYGNFCPQKTITPYYETNTEADPFSASCPSGG